MYRKTITEFKKLALESGAREAKTVDVRTVKTAARVRYKCQLGCPGFGESLTPPLYSPTPEQTQKIPDCYKTAIPVHRRSEPGVNMSKLVAQLDSAKCKGDHFSLVLLRLWNKQEA